MADPGCLSRIPDPDFYPSRIPDLGSRIQKQQQKRGVKKNCCHTFFCSYKFRKIEYYFIFKMPNKKFGPILSKELLKFLPKKLSLNSQKYGVGIRDPRSGIRKKIYSGSQIQGSKRHRIPDPDPQDCLLFNSDVCKNISSSGQLDPRAPLILAETWQHSQIS